ncbi:DUF4198 domain-containing protein [Piscinibacter sp. XHJ-5]|uniref:DUF4198 domain-containing protein n=1 Tax=Piscinibacter sp. XHJ-5 TaxID=3037797 RepID=UPI0024535840|nr:DUF4198 domain-containing protein [Piscinibacter sp. XHJ-5]
MSRLLVLCLALAAAPAQAHDTWFALERRTPSAAVVALGTGNQFPVQESAVGAEQLTRHGCRTGSAAVPLAPGQVTPTALRLQAKAGRGQALSCWAQVMPFDIELTPDKIAVYLKEIHPPPAVHQAWAAMRARGLPWKERYTKHARIEIAGDAPSEAAPSGMAMDVLIEGGSRILHAGDAVAFQVLRDGAPLADFAVELRSDQHRIGFWHQTDAEGRVRVKVPLAGRWVLRGTDLRAVEDAWESRFVTLAFEVSR